MHDLSTTLVAVATAPGRGGIGCVRLSGPRAVEIASAVFVPSSTGRPASALRFGRFVDRAGRPLDHGFLVVFPEHRSYTGEPSAELWVHGSPPILEALVEAALARGGTAAGPGEFTYRAFRRGRLDLAGAEAVSDLIAARTRHQARVAFAQVEGGVARALAPLREGLVELLARGEAAVEFVEEAEVDFAPGRLSRGIAEAAAEARRLLEEARRGVVVRDGARVAIAGLTSVGKSSIFNRLVGTERAIVSSRAGTTRDTLEETIDLDGLAVTLVDTAGLRDAEDPIELEGVRRARAAVEEADLVLFVLDGSRAIAPLEAESLARLREAATPLLLVANKSDLAPEPPPPTAEPPLAISARSGDGWPAFRTALRSALSGGDALEAPVLTRARHRHVLEELVAALDAGALAAQEGLSDEAVLLDVREALDRLGAITGELATDELYDKIFSTFCIGK